VNETAILPFVDTFLGFIIITVIAVVVCLAAFADPLDDL